MFDLIQIRMRLTGAREAAAEAKAASTAIAGTGTAATGAGVAAAGGAKQTNKFTSAVKKMGRIALFSGAAGLAALVYEGVRAVNAYREARKVGKQTNAVIKSTGGLANISAKGVARLAEDLSLRTGLDDEDIQTASNLLLTFRNIRNEVGKNNDIFDQTTAATLDLAAATKTDLVSAAKQVGKAMHDPAVGLTALRRSGVSFSEEQSEMINKLFESGKRLEAQKLILRELNKEFEGSARSQNDAVDRMGVAWENLEEKGGKFLFPTLAKGMRAVTDFVRGLESGKGAGGTFSDVMHAIGAGAGAAVSGVKAAVTWTTNLIRKLTSGKGEVGKFGNDLREIGLAIKDVAVTAFPLFLSYVKKLWSGFKSSFGGIADIVVGVVKIVGGILRGDWRRAWEGAKQLFKGVVSAIIGVVKTMTAPFRMVFEGIASMIGKAFDSIKGPVVSIVNFVIDRINNLIDAHNALPFVGDIAHIGSITEPVSMPSYQGPALNGARNSSDAASGGGRGRRPRLSRPRPTATRGDGGSSPQGSRRRERLQPIHLMLDGKKVAETTLRIADTEAVLA